jgi:hypothetical protein
MVPRRFTIRCQVAAALISLGALQGVPLLVRRQRLTCSGTQKAPAKNLPCSRESESCGPHDSVDQPQENQRLHGTDLPVSLMQSSSSSAD